MKSTSLGRRRAMIVSTALFAGSLFVRADSPYATMGADSLANLSLEELMNIRVTTVSRREAPLSNAPAAVHAITQEDIRRSGTTSLPDTLRLAPGTQVAQVTAHNWAVSVRGFNVNFSNKLLVMIDGRSIYTPLFSGVYWNHHGPMLEDIDRIEVIRGPGASLWGANAVNGVVNVISRDARDTQGTLISAAAGDRENFIGSIRHGGQISEGHYYRAYFHHRDHAGFPSRDDLGSQDQWNFSQGGFRTDRDLSDISTFTLQGDLFRGEYGDNFVRVEEAPPHDTYRDPGNVRAHGGNVLGRITRSLHDDSDIRLQAYYDGFVHDATVVKETRHTVDLDLQHHLPAQDRHMITWGLGYRISVDEIDNSFDLSIDPDSETLQLFSFFLQDEIEVIEDRLTLTLGSKFEHNDFTGFEVQPSGRLSWTPRPRQTVWGAVSRAVRTPSRAERGLRVNLPEENDPVLISMFGSPDFRSEELIAYELGYRVQPHDKISFDLATFYNVYEHLQSQRGDDFRMQPEPAHIPFFADNDMRGETYGFELSSTWKASDFWRLHGSYSLLRMHLRQSPDARDPFPPEQVEGRNPIHQALLRSSFDLPHDWEWDTWFRFVDRLPAQNVGSYLEMDMRFAWKPRPELELALVGRNLIQSRHQEFNTSPLIENAGSEVPRSYYAKVTLNF